MRSNKHLAFNEEFEYLTGRDVPSRGATPVIISIHLIWPLTRNIIWNSIKQMIRVKWFIAINYKINLSINYNFRCSKRVALLQSPAGSEYRSQESCNWSSSVPWPVTSPVLLRSLSINRMQSNSSQRWRLPPTGHYLNPARNWCGGVEKTWHIMRSEINILRMKN